MFFKKKPKKTETKSAPNEYQKAFSWEISAEELRNRSEKNAWRFAALMGVCNVGLTAALVCMMPLKTTEPFVIKVDQSSGEAVVLHIANEKDIPFSEMMDKYWLNQYVLARESYNYLTLSNEFNVTRLLSYPDVFEPYANQFGDRKDSMEQRLKNKKRIFTDIVSIVPHGSDSEGNSVATVRFVKRLVDLQSGAEEARNSWTATISYEYVPDFKVDEPSRLINPFGFKVSSYRVDPELEGVQP